MSKTGQFQKNVGNKQRRNSHNRQENSSSSKPNQNGNSSSGKSSSRNSNSRKKTPRKKGIHPWVSSGPESSQALTSHISMVNKNQSGNGGNRNKAQGQKRRNPSREQRENANKSSARNRSNFDRTKKSNGRNPSNINLSAEKSYTASNSDKKLSGNLDAFTLFCAYHLGIGPNKEYKPSNINEVARRFGQDQGVIKQALKECSMDSASLLDKDFDIALAQLDIQVAPEGIDKMELAKSIYEDFLKAPNVKRDWKKIIEEDRKENRKVFG